MLILTRRIDESVRIGDEITVKIIEIKGDAVRIGITAPREIVVHREEVARRIERESADDRKQS
jgi:carbon storage regulator